MESHDLTGVVEHQFSLDSFTTDAENHVDKFVNSGTTSLIGNVTVSVPEGVIDTSGLVHVPHFSNAHQPIANNSTLTTTSASSGIGHVTLSDISSNLRRISSGPGGLLTGTVISPESLRAVASMFQTLPDSLSQQRSLSGGQAVVISESMTREIQDSDALSVGINLVAGSLGVLGEKEVGRTTGNLNDQSSLQSSVDLSEESLGRTVNLSDQQSLVRPDGLCEQSPLGRSDSLSDQTPLRRRETLDEQSPLGGTVSLNEQSSLETTESINDQSNLGGAVSLSDQTPLGIGVLQVPDNALSALNSGTNVVFTTTTNMSSLVGTAELVTGESGNTIRITDTLQADVDDAVPSSSLLQSEDSQLMVGNVEGVVNTDDAGQQIPVTCQIPTHELARLVQTVEQAGSNVGDLETGSDSVNLINVAGVPSVELSSTGQLLIRQGYVVCTQDGANLVAMTQEEEDVALATNEESVTGHLVAPSTSQSILSRKPATAPTEKKKGKGGWPKGKKRKKDVIEMANAPKPPSSAYAMFLKDQRAGFRESHPEVTGPKVASYLGKMWSNLEPDVKKKYLDMEKMDKERYLREIKEYQESDSCQALLKKQMENSSSSGRGSEESEQISNKNDVLGCNYLQCKVCDLYFTSTHNMKEHVLGKQHMNNLASKICEMDEETLELKALEEGRIEPQMVASTSEECRSCECFKDGMPHTEGFRSTFMDLHFERELELRELRRHHAISIHEQMALRRKFKLLQETLQKSENDHRNLKAIGSNLQSKLDGLYRMILFLT